MVRILGAEGIVALRLDRGDPSLIIALDLEFLVITLHTIQVAVFVVDIFIFIGLAVELKLHGLRQALLIIGIGSRGPDAIAAHIASILLFVFQLIPIVGDLPVFGILICISHDIGLALDHVLSHQVHHLLTKYQTQEQCHGAKDQNRSRDRHHQHREFLLSLLRGGSLRLSILHSLLTILIHLLGIGRLLIHRLPGLHLRLLGLGLPGAANIAEHRLIIQRRTAIRTDHSISLLFFFL